MYVFMGLLGNRAELVFAAVAAILFYLVNAQQRRLLPVIASVVALMASINVIETVRGAPVKDIVSVLQQHEPLDFISYDEASNEQFATHMSLYGVLQYDVEPTYGKTIVSLATSVIPRLLWPNRPSGVYEDYFNKTHASPGEGIGPQGYTIHFATAFYLNFGTPGIVLGGVILGWIWSKLFNIFHADRVYRSTLGQAAAVLAPWTFVANLPMLLRSGPEGLKALCVEAILLPAFAITCAAIKKSQFAPASHRRFIPLSLKPTLLQ
jgi:hypothetical protein